MSDPSSPSHRARLERFLDLAEESFRSTAEGKIALGPELVDLTKTLLERLRAAEELDQLRKLHDHGGPPQPGIFQRRSMVP